MAERPRRPSRLLAAVETIRPLVLLGAFVIVEGWQGWSWAAPFAVATVLAASVLVHDLIHNALYLPKGLNEWLLGAYAQLLLKSGHALRSLHMQHHARCLQDDDHEGNVVHVATARLLLTGPWLALQARWLSWKTDSTGKTAQAVETALNLMLLAALAAATWRGARAPLVYLASVIGVTITVPILGAKIPHRLPERFPGLVRALRPWTTRLTPAASSLLFHELHHRRPRIASALLPDHSALLDTTEPSRCADDPPDGVGR